MNKKYTVLPEPYYTDADELVKDYDLTLSAGDIVTADLTRVDSQGDVYACPVTPNSLGNWINTECLQEVKDRQIYVPDGLTPIEGDEVVGQLVYQDNVVVKGVVERITEFGKIRITITEGPEGNVGDKNREVHQTRILKSPQKEATEGDVILADWERELLTTADGQFLLALTEDELRAVAGEASMLSTTGKSAAAKAKALLPKPKMVEIDSREARLIAQAFKESTLGGVDYWPILGKLGL